ncbi:hypothetical protein BO78DRAFT_364974 [Aspergillus sclerotiicarbonarius CBS 121057]|uniref:Uncharacterized protein n=1 Tax=Aspergillus sclerotiicarbonarius (strain CBS 121057 / IBT 28362) TaxID=1448318 RepID=A0A319EFS0_ASPSB|nr:hypothetical protein BO78DRAFT_364974 [Aspergillus sclerotiicarbonarius CBS 121057]
MTSSSFNDRDLVEPIAVVGLSLRFPAGATDLDHFWDLISDARTAVQDFPSSRLNTTGAYWPKMTSTVKGGHFLAEDVTAFDAPFFSVSAVEAASMDPQQRLLLETSYVALENAGIPMQQVTGSKTSVYVGCFTDDYKTLYQKDVRDSAPYAATGITTTLNANRVSWFYNMTGPSVNIDTACSSSLVALDLACQGLRAGQADMSLVGGANLLLAPDLFHTLSGMNMLSPDSRCYSFDARGNGYGRGEGVGMLVLKRLSRAVQDGDTIRAVIRATACNQNGHTPGITQPSTSAQEALVNECYAQAGLDKARTVYAEAHGTGTPAGDPIEAEALGASFKDSRLPGERLYVGSVKANIGHLEGSSGIAGVIKSIAILERGLIPAIADLQTVNPMINEAQLGLQLPRSAISWPRPGLRRISVNSFGFGGSNAHAVLDDAYHFLQEHQLDGVAYRPRTETPGDSSQTPGLVPPRFRLLPVSSADKAGINRTVTSLTEYFELGEAPSAEFCDSLAYTMAQRRSWLPWRACAVVPPDAPLQELGALVSSPVQSGKVPKIAFVFTGQGAQWAQMGVELCAYAAFRRRLEEADAYLQSLGCEWRLLEELSRPAESSRIDEPRISQVLCTAIQVALVDLLHDFQIRPKVVIGHSSGEIAAAYCCGAISATSAWKIAFFRGSLVSKLREESLVPGAMLAAGLSPSDAAAYLAQSDPAMQSLSIACFNSPDSVTISGDEVAIDALKTKLDTAGVFARKLRTGVAYHSAHMYPVAEAYTDAIGDIEPGPESLAGPVMISTVSSQQTSPDVLRQGSYWASNLVSPVRFLQGFQRFLTKRVTKKMDGSHRNLMDIDACLEIGPHGALRGPIKSILAAKERSMTYLSPLQRKRSGLETMLESVGQLWCLGVPVDWLRVNHEGQDTAALVSLADLPPYAWDHSRTYFHESRVSKNHRLREKPRSDLLGEPAVDWNPLEARWGNFIKLSEHPWVEDHRINGTILFPAAGMMAMAVEAVKLTTTGERPIAGYELREIRLTAALSVPDHERGVETQFFLRRQPGDAGREATWSDFRLCANVEDSWEEVCSGSIRVDYGVSDSGVGSARAASDHLQAMQGKYSRICNEMGSPMEMETFYQQLQQCGLDFGPTFRTLTAAQWADKECSAVVHVHPESDYVVHPCTLDALLHMPMVPLTQDPARPKSTAIPAKIRRVWLASSGLGWSATDTLHAASTVVAEDRRGCEVCSHALTTDGSQVLAELEGMRLTVVNDGLDMADRDAAERDGTWNLVWRPDVELLTRPELDQWCAEPVRPDGDAVDFYRELAFLHYCSLKQAVVDVAAGELSPQPPHLQQYVRWAQEQVQQIESGQLPHWESAWESLAQDAQHRQTVEDRLEQTNGQGKAHVTVARHLQQILRGEVDPLELLFGSPLLEDLYAELSADNKSFDQLDRYLRLYSHKHPNARYLEIGAGTGGTTAPVLRSLVGEGDPQITGALYQDFTYTDISEAFFESAQTRFAQYPNLAFHRLDVEQPLPEQGLPLASYDVIVAANVLHATKDLVSTLQNVEQLLRPGGKLILFEITNPALGRSGFIMGLLPGWWLSTEAYRTCGPCVSPPTWNTVLQEAGFTGVEHDFHDYNSDGCHELSVLVSTKTPSPSPPPELLPSTVNIITGTPISEARYANALEQQLRDEGIASHLVSMDQIQSASLGADALTIMTADWDLHRPFLRDLSAEDFAALQHLVGQSQNLVWLTPTVDDGSSAPEYNMVTGLARVCHAEVEGQKFMRVGTDPGPEPTPSQVQGLLRAIQQMLVGSPDTYEMEFEQRRGLFHISRLQLDAVCQEEVHDIQNPRLSRDLAWQDAPPLKLVTETPGLLESLVFVEDDEHSLALADDEVEIEVRAVGLNFKDCLIALGRVPADTLGNECAGVVFRVGSACLDRFQVGDRVCMSTVEAFKTYARSKAQCVCPLPDSISFTEAAAIPTQFVTAWTSLVEIGRLARGERVLIHAGAGGTGQAAVQISQYLGAEVFVTVGSEAKRQVLMTTYNLPEDHIFYSRDTSFATGIKNATQGRGVHVVLNSLSGDNLLASWDCLAPYGRFVEIGKKDILDNARLPMLPFNRGVSFSAFDGSIWMVERPDQAERGIRTILDLFRQGVFHVARPLQVLPVSDVHRAFATLADGKTSGKTVIEITPEAVVPTIITRKPTYFFPTDATYVLAGGFGGIGRSIARWMADRGARNLLILSRSGPKTPEAARLVDDLRGAGINIQAPACDITDVDSLQRVLDDCCQTMPPIRGCIQASMVLQDTLLNTMTHTQWTTAVKPKVDGSRNLDALLPHGMDFFVMLASVSGIAGQRGQSNYAAGNTYQDSLARHRVARGEAAISIDLGAMVDDGFLAQNQTIRDRLLGGGSMLPITRDQFLALLDYHCDPSHKPTLTTSQTIFGINSPQAMHARGLDEPSWMQRPMFGFLHRVPATARDQTAGEAAAGGHRARDFRAELAQAQTVEEGALIVATGLIAKLVTSLSGLEEADVQVGKSVVSCGVDSLLAVEIRSWFAKVFQADIPTFEILGGLSFEKLGRLVAGRSALKRGWVA